MSTDRRTKKKTNTVEDVFAFLETITVRNGINYNDETLQSACPWVVADHIAELVDELFPYEMYKVFDTCGGLGINALAFARAAVVHSYESRQQQFEFLVQNIEEFELEPRRINTYDKPFVGLKNREENSVIFIDLPREKGPLEEMVFGSGVTLRNMVEKTKYAPTFFVMRVGAVRTNVLKIRDSLRLDDRTYLVLMDGSVVRDTLAPRMHVHFDTERNTTRIISPISVASRATAHDTHVHFDDVANMDDIESMLGDTWGDFVAQRGADGEIGGEVEGEENGMYPDTRLKTKYPYPVPSRSPDGLIHGELGISEDPFLLKPDTGAFSIPDQVSVPSPVLFKEDLPANSPRNFSFSPSMSQTDMNLGINHADNVRGMESIYSTPFPSASDFPSENSFTNVINSEQEVTGMAGTRKQKSPSRSPFVSKEKDSFSETKTFSPMRGGGKNEKISKSPFAKSPAKRSPTKKARASKSLTPQFVRNALNPPPIEWVNSLREFLYDFMEPFVPDDDTRLAMLDERAMPIWIAAFTTRSADEKNNYEELETIGDRLCEPSFALYIFSKYGSEDNIISNSEMTETKNRYMAKELQAERSMKYGFINHVRLGDRRATRDLHEDIYESFVGALFITAEMIDSDNASPDLIRRHLQHLPSNLRFRGELNGLGFILVRTFHQWEFENTKIDLSIRPPTSFVQQSLRALKIRFENDDIEHYTVDDQDDPENLGITATISLPPNTSNALARVLSEGRYPPIQLRPILGVGHADEFDEKTKERAKQLAYKEAAEYLKSMGMTEEFVARKKEELLWSEQDPAAVRAMYDRAARDGIKKIEIKILRDTGKNNRVAQLLGYRVSEKKTHKHEEPERLQSGQGGTDRQAVKDAIFRYTGMAKLASPVKPSYNPKPYGQHNPGGVYPSQAAPYSSNYRGPSRPGKLPSTGARAFQY
jgi:dsRNA-specific ribonuclease